LNCTIFESATADKNPEREDNFFFIIMYASFVTVHMIRRIHRKWHSYGQEYHKMTVIGR